jgi:hypothetical protein
MKCSTKCTDNFILAYIVGPYTMAVASWRWVWFNISPVFTDFSNSAGVEYLAFLSKQGEKMVSAEPSNLRKKIIVPGEMICSP